MSISYECQLYRHFDKDDILLYVGISWSTISRWSQHLRGSPWSARVVKITIQTFETREAALDAECKAIKEENPAFNTVRVGSVSDKARQKLFIMPDNRIEGIRYIANYIGVHRHVVRMVLHKTRIKGVAKVKNKWMLFPDVFESQIGKFITKDRFILGKLTRKERAFWEHCG